MENNIEFKFEVEVIERLTKIESKLDGYKEIERISRESDNRSKQNERRIDTLEDRNKWLARVAVGAIIGEIIGVGFMLVQMGLGV